MHRLPLAIGLTALIAATPSFAEIARVKQSSGAAHVERSAQQLKPAPGLQLQTGDKLVTGKDGRISVTFVDNTRFAVGPNSRVSSASFNTTVPARKVQWSRRSIAARSLSFPARSPSPTRMR